MNIREIARRARVSHSTVSRVINQVETVDPKLVRRVQAVIQEVGYRPNFQARALARGRSHTVGLIVSELTGGNPFFSEIILYFERAAVEQGYEVLVSFADTETRPGSYRGLRRAHAGTPGGRHRRTYFRHGRTAGNNADRCARGLCGSGSRSGWRAQCAHQLSAGVPRRRQAPCGFRTSAHRLP